MNIISFLLYLITSFFHVNKSQVFYENYFYNKGKFLLSFKNKKILEDFKPNKYE